MSRSRRTKTVELLRTARRQQGVATTRQALAAGFSPAAVDRAVASGEWRRVHHGIYVVDPAADPIRAAMLGHVLRAPERTWVSHESAAWLWGWSTSVPLRPHVSTTANLRGGRATIHRLSSIPVEHVTAIDGMPVTSVARTLVDLAGAVAAERLEAAVIEAVRAGLVAPREIRECAEALVAPGRSGPRGMLRMLDAWDPLAPPESVLESRLLRVIRSGRLPVPAVQFEVALPNGGRARLDFAYPDAMVAIEADGYRWHGDAARWRSDLTRRNELTRMGWRTLHFTWRDITQRPRHVVETVRSALGSRSQVPEKREFAT